MRKIFLLCMAILLLMSVTVFAEEAKEEIAESTVEDNSNLKVKENDVKRNFEIQLEYFNGKIFNNRNVNNYNVHVFQQFKQYKVLSLYRGLTVTRATGYSRPSGKGWLDSEGVGVGPAFMMRCTKPIAGKLSLAGDFTGSLMFYNKAHPAEGRAYGFLWRAGPRIMWQSTDRDTISLGYSISHFSNGLRSHNPGYNGLGFTLNFQHRF